MDQHAICSTCGEHWTPSDVMPLGLCPTCEGLYLPARRPVHDLRQKLTALHACLADLLQ